MARVLLQGALVSSLAIGLLYAAGCGREADDGSAPAAADASDDQPAFLLVQSAKSFEYDGERLTVRGASPSTIFFSDRPDRIAGHMPLDLAFDWADPSFREEPPNATLSSLEAGEMANVVITLRDAVLAGDSVSWDVDVLEGELLPYGGPNTLFIDVIGRPATPLSFAGAHRRSNRRTRRRSLAVGMTVGAVAASAASSSSRAASADAASESAAAADDAADAADEAADAAADAAEAASAAADDEPGIEEQLRDLKDLYDKGLITQADYDAKRQEILDSM